MHLLRMTSPLAPAALLCGCATLFNGTTNTLKVESPTPAVAVSISNANKATVANVTTPSEVKLHPAEGPFMLIFKDAAGHQQDYEVQRGLSGWLFGNVLLGGLIGLGIDLGTGSLHTLKPHEVNMDMLTGVNLADPEGPRASAATPAGTPPVTAAAAAVPAPVAQTEARAPEAPAPVPPKSVVLMAGQLVKAYPGTAFLAQAKPDGRVLATLDGSETVTLNTAMSNPSGQWWFVKIGNQAGWVAANRLIASP